MEPMALVFFVLFTVVLVGMYLLIRRRIAPIGAVAAVGMIGSILTMTLFSLGQGNLLAHALLVGFIVGGGMSVITLALSWYFLSTEVRAKHTPKTE
jgi:hypothetical protein